MGAQSGTVLIAGLGPGLGEALAARFSAAGYDVAGLSRCGKADERARQAVTANGREFTAISCDLSDPGQIASAVEGIAGDVQVLIYNAHSLLIRPLMETDSRDFETLWRVACLGAAMVSKALSGPMIERGSGSLIFTGATASIRGSANFSAFASAKFALRGLAQSLARELGPAGIHVCHMVLDGLIDEPQSTERFGAPPASSARMSPEEIAEFYFQLSAQQKSAWTFEADLRPFSEKF